MSPNASTDAVRSIVIVGGGSAGWMTAAALSSLLPSSAVSITLVESDDIGTVGVGEATIPDIINFNHLLGIDEAEFLRATNGTFKLGIEFVDWETIGKSYFHPFGNHGADMQGIDFHQYWMKSRTSSSEAPLEDYSLCATAGRGNKFVLPTNDPRSVLSQLRYAYHFDATAYAKFLRGFAEKRGVRRIEGKVSDVALDADSGFIQSIRLENENTIPGDLFVDCSGFRSLLIEGALGVQFEDWSHFLPCDRAQAVACERNGPLLPYTRSTATAEGWRWRIPTQHRTGNGQIYCSQFMEDDAAADALLNALDGSAIGTPRKIQFRTGRRQRLWEKNCVAIGLSGGFLEPLESTSLYLIQEGISKLISLFPTAKMAEVVRNEYNTLLGKKFDQVRDFIILHYKATKRDDSPFWNYCRTMDIPDSLKDRIELFREAGRIFRYEDELFTKPSWVAVMIGQGITPRTTDPIADSVPDDALNRSLSSMRAAISQAASKMPTHEEFIKKYAPAAAH